MKCAGFPLLVAALVVLAGCSQSPTGPTRAIPRSDAPTESSLLASWASQGIAVADWRCLAEHIGCPFQADFAMPPAEDIPGAPSSLASQVSGTTITLTWSAPAGGGVATYVLEAGTAAGQSNIASFATGGTATTFTATGLPNGTYFVRVRARNADGTSVPSNEVVITIGGAPCPPPPQPNAFTANAHGNTVELSWLPVADATSYVIEAGTLSGRSNILVFDTGTSATAFAGSAPDGTYYLRVRARNACGLGEHSNEVVVTVGGAPPPRGPLEGLWGGTITPRLSNPQGVDFTQSGTTLIGVVRGRDVGQSITFRLTETGTNIFTGTMTFEGTGGAPCGAGVQSGSVTISAGSPTTMTGSFTLPASGSCPKQTNQVSLTKL